MADPQTAQSEHHKYLQELHKRLVTPDPILDQVILKALNSHPETKVRLIAGEINEVYELKLKDGQTVILRIFHGDENEFEFEEWPINEAAKVGVPVPKIISLQTVPVNGKPRYFCIQEKLNGQTVDKRPVMPPAEDHEYLHKIVRQAGAILSKIHQVKTPGFGPISKDGKTKYPTLTERLDYRYEFKKYKQVLERIEVEPGIIDQAKAILDKHHDLLESVEPRLIHGDFGPKHILIENQQITGIIDFGNAHGGDIAEEFAGWDIWYHSLAPMEWLMEDYGNKEIFTDEFKTRIELQRIIRTLDLIRYYGESDRLSAVERTLEQLKKGIEYFK